MVDRPPGVFEFESFAKGTKSMMDAIVESTAAGSTTIIGQLVIVDEMMLHFVSCL